jgi:LysM repeat protein
LATEIYLGDILISPAPRYKLKFNNPRSIARIDIPGSSPVYQDMGDDETTLAWDGVFVGDDAYKKGIQIEALKDAGKAIQLVVSDFPELSKKVRIRSFPWEVIRSDRVEYSIELVAEIPPPVVLAANKQTVSQTGNQSSGQTTQTKSTGSLSSGVTYTIKQGDTLWAIAAKTLGNGARWREIAGSNNIIDPKKLKIGQQIQIPGRA